MRPWPSTVPWPAIGASAQRAAACNTPGDAGRARRLVAADCAEAETLDKAREFVRFDRLQARLTT